MSSDVRECVSVLLSAIDRNDAGRHEPGVRDEIRGQLVIEGVGGAGASLCELARDESRRHLTYDELHAAILRVKLRRLDEWNNRRRAIAANYREAFRQLPLGMQAETGSSNYHLFVVTSPRRDKLRAHLADLQIPALIHYPIPLHRQRAFCEFGPARCPNADLLCSRVLSLPIHAFMSDVDVERVIDGVRGFLRR